MRKPLPTAKKRVTLNCRVTPATLQRLKDLSESLKMSLGKVIDHITL